jgi:hypothetical protein
MNGWVGGGQYVFAEACKDAFPAEDWEPVWNLINDVFGFLPVFADVDESVICTHGGLAAEMGSLEEFEQQCLNTLRPFDIKRGTVFYGLLWNDLDYDSVSPNVGSSPCSSFHSVTHPASLLTTLPMQ